MARMSLSLIKERLAVEGFPVSGGVDAFDSEIKKKYDVSFQAYKTWVDRKRHANMAYLSRGLTRREDPSQVYPDLKSVLCVAWEYSPLPVGELNPLEGVRYARYLSEKDYHRSGKLRLDSAMEKLRETYSSLAWKSCVDTSAVLERSWAALCGIGWIGKNGMIIHPQLGSYLFLAVVFTNMELDENSTELSDYCGACQRCLDGCPTSAFIGNKQVDSNRCISYQTLEHRGVFGEAHESNTNWIAGCDVCQEVCPFNRKSVKRSERKNVSLPLSVRNSKWIDLIEESEGEYRTRIKETALSRIKYVDHCRNLIRGIRSVAVNSLDRKKEFKEAIEKRLEIEVSDELHSQWKSLLYLFE